MNKSKTKIKLNEFSLTLVYIISESINMYSFSKNENKELVYFFLNAIYRMLFSRNLGNDIRDKVLYNIIFEIFTNTSFFKEGDFDLEAMFIKFGDEYNMRIDTYSKCNNFILFAFLLLMMILLDIIYITQSGVVGHIL